MTQSMAAQRHQALSVLLGAQLNFQNVPSRMHGSSRMDATTRREIDFCLFVHIIKSARDGHHQQCESDEYRCPRHKFRRGMKTLPTSLPSLLLL